MVDESIPQKQCRKCELWFPFTEQYFTPRSPSKLRSHCRNCERERLKTVSAAKRREKGARIRESNFREGEQRCTICKEWKPANGEFFYLDKRNKSGVASWCKECTRQRTRPTPEKIFRSSQQRRERRIKDPQFHETEKLKSIEYYHKPEIRERTLKRQKERYASDPQLRQRQKEQRQLRHQTERGKAIAVATSARRRALKLNAEGTYTAADIELQYKSQKGKCWHCGAELNGTYDVDHLIPLSRGGTNWPNNLVCACSHCNRSKHNKLPHEWNGKLF